MKKPEKLNLLKELNWRRICREDDISEDFIREFQDYIDWSAISYYGADLSNDFIIEFKNKLDINLIAKDKICNLDEDNEEQCRTFLKLFLDDIDLIEVFDEMIDE